MPALRPTEYAGRITWIGREGVLRLGEMLPLHIPDQPVWSELARERGALL